MQLLAKSAVAIHHIAQRPGHAITNRTAQTSTRVTHIVGHPIHLSNSVALFRALIGIADAHGSGHHAGDRHQTLQTNALTQE